MPFTKVFQEIIIPRLVITHFIIISQEIIIQQLDIMHLIPMSQDLITPLLDIMQMWDLVILEVPPQSVPML